MPKKQKPEDLKTRPDLDDQSWIVWLAAQKENRGIFVAEMYRQMLDWCMKKGVTPTRRRLLKWMDNEREAIPVTYKPAYFQEGASASVTDKEPPAPKLPDCTVCHNERFVQAVVKPDAPYDWAQKAMVPCTACQPEVEDE